MSVMSEMHAARERDVAASEELRAGARALIERNGPLVLNRAEVLDLGAYLWGVAEIVQRLENTVIALAGEIVEEAALPPAGTRRIPFEGKVS